MTFGIGMRRCDFASATAHGARMDNPAGSNAPRGRVLLEERVPEHKAAALSALLSDFRIERRLTKADGGDFGAIAGWFGSR
ncbi:MAG: hypothetical protein WA633_18150, partial [Stellaceae bacterium]